MKPPVHFQFCLYVAGDAQNSLLAIANLREFCRLHLHDRHDIEIVDVLREPKCALANRVLMTPTLIKIEPSPMRRIVGTLSQTEILLRALGLSALAA